MKKYLFCLFTVLILAHPVMAQRYIEDINNALRSGDVSSVARYFDKVIDITISNESTTYSKSQAQMVLKDFFGKNSIRSFQLTNRGGDAGSTYLIGRMSTANGTYVVFLFLRLKANDNTPCLQEIKFERQ